MSSKLNAFNNTAGMNSGFRRAARMATSTVCVLALTCPGSIAQGADAAVDQPSAPPPITAEFKAAAKALGATVTDDGWIYYNDVLADTAYLLKKTTKLITGRKSADGTCTVSASGTVPVGSLGYYSETKAFNPQTCQEMVEGGFLTTMSARQLHLSTSSTDTGDPSATADSNLPTEEDSSTADASATDDQAGQQKSSDSTRASTTEAAATRTSKAYSGSRWVDPLYIVITALTVDLTWKHNGSSVPSASYVIKPYEFPYDGWFNSGTPHPPFTFKPGSVNVTASEMFVNTDFENLLLANAARFGPAAVAAVLAACRFDTSPAVFKHTESITGKADGSYSWSYNDSKKGGCSSLVHHDSYNGYGTF
jgi:hypothetical protein